MAKRDEEREKVKQQQAEERAAANAEAQRQAQARIAAAQEANKLIMQVGLGVGCARYMEDRAGKWASPTRHMR